VSCHRTYSLSKAKPSLSTSISNNHTSYHLPVEEAIKTIRQCRPANSSMVAEGMPMELHTPKRWAALQLAVRFIDKVHHAH
jgi:hypothetical protein